MMLRQLLFILIAFCICPAYSQTRDTARGDKMIAEYFRGETERIRQQQFAEIESLEDWQAKRKQYHQQLMDMLGLNPLPKRTDLRVQVTGTTEHADFVVDRLHFQSRPGLYVTANLYRPRQSSGKLPAVLYVCGHGAVKKEGVSFGNKVHYHHHGSWFARNGYVCLTIDTLQLGEIEGIHHGTYREKMWWWLNRGYTPAGVEAWNCIRALDYLQSRDDVDGERIGVTGRSGGGAYSWWIAAIDDRIRCAVPVAGITDLRNHVYDGNSKRFADGCVEGHCDCMFMFNTYQWDYPMVAALVAPRPLLISNTDTDSIFPLDGVYRTFTTARDIYELYGKPENIALNITPGGHSDTQELRVSAFHWLNHHLRDEDSPITTTADKFFEPEQLRVFTELPDDQKNTTIQESFVPTAAAPATPASEADWNRSRDFLMQQLSEQTFRGWPEAPEDSKVTEAFRETAGGLTLRAVDFTSQSNIRLRLYIAHRESLRRPELVVLNAVDETGWADFLTTMSARFGDKLPAEVEAKTEEFQALSRMLGRFDWVFAWVAPRGIGETRWDQSERKQTQHRRRFYLLGQSLDGMRAWDIRRAMQVVRADSTLGDVPLWIQAHRSMAGIALYASLFEPPPARLDLHELDADHRNGPFLLNVRRFMNIPEAAALAAARGRVVIYDDQPDRWSYPRAVADLLEREKNFAIREPVTQ